MNKVVGPSSLLWSLVHDVISQSTNNFLPKAVFSSEPNFAHIEQIHLWSIPPIETCDSRSFETPCILLTTASSNVEVLENEITERCLVFSRAIPHPEENKASKKV